MKFEEIKIAVPWGYVAAKAWGNSINPPVIAIHGLLDNAGSFDTLIPNLPNSFYYVCMDLPGHGLSSHFTPTLPVEYTTLIVALMIALDNLKREKYVIIGHGISATLSVLYAQLRPDKVSKLVLLDSTYTAVYPPGTYLSRIEEAHGLLMKYLAFEPEKRKAYSYREAVKKVIRRRPMGNLTFKCAENLVVRMVENVGDDKYMFTSDGRFNSLIRPSLNYNYVKHLLEIQPVTCDILVIYTSYTLDVGSKVFKYMEPYMDIFREHRIDVEGDHHTHHTAPEKIAPYIVKFLLGNQNKL